MTSNTFTEKGVRIRAAKWAGYFLLAFLNGMVGLRSAQGAYIDCTACHFDPAPDSAAADYSDYYVTKARHAVAVSYPTNSDYRPPNATALNITFFDANHNGVVDPEEIQLFGVDRRVECSSCHREHGEAPPPPAPKMYLRLPGEALCGVCHDR